MGKNGSRLVSFRQYRFVDLLVFMLIMIVFEMINFFAANEWFEDEADFAITVTLLITLLVTVRWNWLAIIFPIVDGAVYCALMSYSGWYYLIYCVGNIFPVLTALLFIKVPQNKVFGKWYFTVMYVLLGYILIVFGRTCMAAIVGVQFVYALRSFSLRGLFDLIFTMVGFLILRNIDGMVENQKAYLFRKKREAEEMRRRDEFGEDPIEIDEETLAILKKDSNSEGLNKRSEDLFKKD